jgi:putative sterol carrier protein
MLARGRQAREHAMDLGEVAAAMAQRIGGKTPIGGTLKFDLGSDGCLFIDGTGADNTVMANKSEPADCTIKMSAGDFDAMIHGRLQPAAAFMSGKMTVDGDIGLAMRLGQLV